MEFEGVVFKILPPTSGTSARGEWKRQEVVFELPQEFSRKICVTFFNKESEVSSLREGQTCNVSVNVESREYNGRWYTDVKVWRIQPKSVTPPAESAPMPDCEEYQPVGVSSAKPSPEDIDDLPF